MSNHHQSTVNASTNTSINDNSNSSIGHKPASVELPLTSTLIKIPSTSASSSQFVLPSPTLSPSSPLGNFHKTNKFSLNVNQHDSSLILSSVRSEELIEKKFNLEHSFSSSIDTSRFCRFIFPDSTSAIILASTSTETIQHAIHYLFAKRGITWYRTELFSMDQQPVDIREPLAVLSGKEIRVELRILIRLDFPAKIFCIRCDPKRTLIQILQPVVENLNSSIGKFVFYSNDCLIPLNLNEQVGCYDNQRIFAFTKTASGVDMSSRHRKKITNDIFDMISENDDDIHFDEYGILKVVQKSKSTHVVASADDVLHSPTTSSTDAAETEQTNCTHKR